MSFGEIIEPTTRALNGDDYLFLPETSDTTLEWDGDFSIPHEINQLIFIESGRILKIFNAVLSNLKPICTLQKGLVQIFDLNNGTYIVSYVEREITTGQIVVALEKWLEKSRKIDAITSGSLVTFLNSSDSETSEILLRKLSNSSDCYPCKNLEQPNIVTGLGAQVLSHSIFSGSKCTLYIFYMLNTPLDSLATRPVFELINYLGLKVTNNAVFEENPHGNLYC